MTIESRVSDVEEALRLLRNANRLQGRPLSATAPDDNQLIGWNATTKKWEPKSPSLQLSRATSSLTLTTTAQSITGDGDSSKVRLLLPSIGAWLIIGAFDFEVTATDPDECIGELFVNDSGSGETGAAFFGKGQVDRGTVSQRWKVTTTAANISVELKAKKQTNAGTALANATHTTIMAIGIAGGTAIVAATDHGDLTGLGDTSDHAWATLIDGTRAFTGDQSMGTNKLTNVVDPTSDQEAATKKYHDDNGQSVALLDGSEHTDTVAQGVTQGSLILGNATPAWDELVIGADHTVLVSNGTTASWSAAPPLANIADTGDTNRITLATSGDNVTLTGEVAIAGHLDIDGADGGGEIMVSIAPTTTGVTNWQGVTVSPTITFTGNSRFVRGVFGQALVNIEDTTGSKLYGLDFSMNPRVTDALTGTSSEVFSLWAHNFVQTAGSVSADYTITDLAAGAFQTVILESAGSMTVTNAYGIFVKSSSITGAAGPAVTNYYGIKVGDETGGKVTNVFLAEIGPSVPYLRVEGNWTRAANLTPIIISEGTTNAFRVMSTEMAFLSVTSDDTATSSSSLYDVWDQDNYPSATLNTTDNVAAKNITYTKADGKFTFDVAGIYEITFTISPTSASIAAFTIELQDGGGAFYSHPSAFAHSAVDPTLQSVTVIRSFSATDFLNVLVNGTALVANVGTTITIHKVADITEDKVLILDNTAA